MSQKGQGVKDVQESQKFRGQKRSGVSDVRESWRLRDQRGSGGQRRSGVKEVQEVKEAQVSERCRDENVQGSNSQSRT